ncbi:protein FD-like [Chenopodium quinoa]|uniref:protein FD-like n=1 Tax=Chenopodium quinoa TaxID=63459 RepID=UPI000B786B3C|nr:protein FD-like [Chenopodium quinoa]
MFSSSSPPSNDSTLFSPSSSSSSSPSSHLKTNNQNSESTTKITQTQKTMEEIWKDITTNSIPNTPISHIHSIHHNSTTNTTSHYKGFILQDFLNGGNGPTNLRNSSVNSPPLPPRTTTTEFQFLDNEFQLQGNPSVPSMIAGVASFGNLASSSVLTFATAVNGSCGGGFDNKKVTGNVEDGSVDRIRRHKRMIKNRESAARSRARKQAYITELELEIDNFKRENAALRKQGQLIEAPSAQLPKKHGLRRTSTAPF